MRIEDLQNDPFLFKLLQQMAYLVGMSFQQRAAEALTVPQTMGEGGEGGVTFADRMEELFDNEEFFPEFNTERHNYLTKPNGYVCKSPKGNLVYLLQPYDSSIYTAEPEDLPAQWGFYWSPNPKYAKEFIQSATSPYYKGACCLYDGEVYRSLINANVHSPAAYPAGWEKVEMG